MHIDQTTIDAVLEDWTTAPVSERLHAGLKLAEALTTRPQEIDGEFIASLTAAGLDNAALEDVATIAFRFNMMNRLADAFDFPLLDDDQGRKLAKALDRAGKIFGNERPEPSYARGADGILRPVEIEHSRAGILDGHGLIDPALRQAVEAYAAGWFGGQRSVNAELPDPLRAYIEKLARWAYRIIDEDIDALKQAGYVDEAIFELTFIGAIGASLPALERLFTVLYDRS